MSASAVRARLPLYSAIRQAALAQQQALECDDLEAFRRLMAQREELLAGIEAPSLSDEPGFGGSARPPAELAYSAEKQAAALLVEILHTDRELQRLLATRIDETRADLARLRSGRQASRAYLSTGKAGGMFVDSQG